jgi:arylsulfatase A-like enzyme
LNIPHRRPFQSICRLLAFALLTTFLSNVAATSSLLAADKPSRPNVVLIMTDDMGYGDLGFVGNPLIRTPNLDAMALRSARMNNFYVSPVCAPTRACLMTGRYNYRTRCIDTYIGRAMMEPAEVTVAELMGENGYATGIFGKWHLGDCYPMRAIDQGYQTALVHRGGGIGQPSDPVGGEGKYTDPILFRNGKAEQMNGYCTDLYYSGAMEFIQKSHDAKKPFFAYIPDNCPHGPFHDVPVADYEYYRKLNLGNDQFPQKKGHPLPKKADQDKRARIFAMITNVDRNIGRLFAKLDALKITRDTLVIFMVDNGPNGRRYVAGMNGMKSWVYEGGIRSPFFAQWPAVLKAGQTSDSIAAHIDVLPTILEAAGVTPPKNLKLDGRSLLSDLKGQEIAHPPRTLFIQSHRGDQPTLYHNFMARTQRWKLVHPSGFGRERFAGDPKLELYDMQADPLETNNLAAKKPEVLASLKKQYEAWFADVSSTRKNNYAPPRIHVGTPHENTTVLTRQDWRHTQGRPWARDSAGHWLLHVVKNGNYDLHCRFTAGKAKGIARLKLNDRNITLPVPAGATSLTFPNFKLAPGDLKLEVVLESGKTKRGIHQADLVSK